MFKKNFKKYILLPAAIGLLIFFHYLNFLNPIEEIVQKASRPALVGLYKISSYLRITFNTQTDKRDLIKLLREKEDEINGLLAENARLKSLEEENEILRQYLKFFKEEKKPFVLASIIFRGGFTSNNLEKNIIIDKGSADGIKEEVAVLDDQGVIIGKVTQIKNNLSEVCLITNAECKIAAKLQNNDKTAGIIKGEHGLTIKMEFVPQTEEVKEGDIVVTSGLEQSIPRGLVIGKVTKVDKVSNELWQSAIIEPLVDLDNLSIVAVLL
jgi:rod shape-determining protein MreC